MASKITEDTSVKTDIKTIGSLIAAAGFAVYMYIGMTNTINTLETRLQLMEADLLKKADQVPVDKEQFFLLEALAEDTEKQQKLLDENIHVKVMLEAARQDIEKLKKDVEKLKDATRDIQFGNGNGNGY
jgi:septal ring factor EnvC (AmiA/AmiB activator)